MLRNDEETYGHNFRFFNRNIKTKVTKSHQFVDSWLQRLNQIISPRHLHIVGFGVEIYDNAIATMTLCYDRKCLIYHMALQESFPPCLKLFLSKDNCLFVSFGLESDQRFIPADYLIRYQCLVQYGNRYFFQGYKDLSLLAKIVVDNLDLVRPQPGRACNSLKLSDKQIEYASIGAYVCLQIGNLLYKETRPDAPQRTIFKWNRVDYPIDQVHEVQVFDKTIITTVTRRLLSVEKWMADVIRKRHPYDYIGFDVQCYHDATNTISTVQFCVDTRCLIFQLERMNGRYLPKLEHFLLRGNNTFVGIGIPGKMGKLKDALYFEYEGRLKVIDLGEYVAEERDELLLFAKQDNIARKLFGLELERPQDVEPHYLYNPFITKKQVQNACIDAAASYEIGKRLLRLPD